MTVKLPEMPGRIAALPRDSRGYPVPRFVQWMKDGKPCPRGEGEPDFRVADSSYRYLATNRGLCWVCGAPLGRHRVFVLGPMCAVNQVTSEPPCCRSCAEFAAVACPFLVKPRMKRLPLDDLPFDREEMSPGGVMIDRNPGCIGLYETSKYGPIKAHAGWLISLGAPTRVDWWAEGRKATRAEVWASIESGYPLLLKMARRDGRKAVADLEKMRDAAMQWLPAAMEAACG